MLTHLIDKAIKKLISERHGRGSPMTQAALFHDTVNWDKIKFIDIPKPKSRRMAYTAGPDQSPVEVTLFCTGIIYDKETLPMMKPISKERAKGHKQSIKLTGYGSEAFQAAIDGMLKVTLKFERSFPEDSVTPWTVGETVKGEALLELSCKTLLHVADRSNLENVPIDDVIDLYGHMRAVIGDRFIRTEENIVECFRMQKSLDGTIEYKPMNIVELRKGNAVEAKFCFVAYPTFKTDISKVVPVLRGINLIDEGARKKYMGTDAPVAKLARKRMRASDDVE
ncbi:hypothetical protein C8J56DRAFT_1047630 [Mycena floridula]|nr:hypothetical protein C8J56DRAFT_1047630 [Mycena floridula]